MLALLVIVGLWVPAHAQDRPRDPFDPFPGGVPAPARPDPARATAVVDQLEQDIATWSPEAARTRRALAEVLAGWRRGRRPAADVDALTDGLGTVLQVLPARLRLAEARVEALGVDLSPRDADRLEQARSRIGAVVREHLQVLISARLLRADGALRAGDPVSAATQAQALHGLLEALAPTTGPWPETDPARLTLVRLALTLGLPDRARAWAASCAATCATREAREQAGAALTQARRRVPGQRGESVDPLMDLAEPGQAVAEAPADESIEAAPPRPREPDHLRGRATVTWMPGLFPGSHLGAPVRRGVSGAVDLAWAPTPAACGSLRLAHDRFRHVGSATDDRRLARTRVEVAACPRVGAVVLGRTTLGLRAVIGAGVSVGRDRPVDGSAGVERLVGWGLTARAEVPVQVGPIEIVPSLGAAPYGRARDWGLRPERAPYAFVDRVHLGLGVSLGLR